MMEALECACKIPAALERKLKDLVFRSDPEVTYIASARTSPVTPVRDPLLLTTRLQWRRHWQWWMLQGRAAPDGHGACSLAQAPRSQPFPTASAGQDCHSSCYDAWADPGPFHDCGLSARTQPPDRLPSLALTAEELK
ncbi:hypothetical protein QTO34_015871 [Cnephaeus nilssonii]|uniref:Uncharacterized protein n=1 Tax=Cnephaeus nilssonii TaxID=3371016 RepID=A0AA40I4X2_CNENI|nr:hypothetical protein QTO34_015871 [Eptesicus nilssonii]